MSPTRAPTSSPRASSNPHFKSRLARSMTSSHPSDATYVAQLLSRGVENLAEVRALAHARATTHSLRNLTKCPDRPLTNDDLSAA